MQAQQRRQPLERTQPTIPSEWYFDPGIFEREMDTIWTKEWLYVGRSDEVAERRDYKVVSIGDERIVLVRDLEGRLRAFHNTCRHRGSFLCTEDSGSFDGGSIVCPYHAWTYSLDGRLIATPHQLESADFDMGDYSLYGVAAGEWGGFMFINLSGEDAEPLEATLGDVPERFANFHTERLKVGATETYEMTVNWKVFWENFSECFHCPSVHPELSKVVPIFGKGLLSDMEDPTSDLDPDQIERDPATGRPKPRLGEGMVTWTMDGTTDLPYFPDLTDEEKATGHSFAVIRPSWFVAFHPDFLRVGQITARGPERTDLIVEWLFQESVLADPEFDARKHVDLGILITEQDALVCEYNQKGLHSNRHEHGLLTLQEHGVAAIHDYVRARLGEV